MRLRRPVALGAALAALVAIAVPIARAAAPSSAIQPGDWTTDGGSAHHTVSNATGLTTANGRTLAPKWIFKTGYAATANPDGVRNRGYLGSWGGNFHAIHKDPGTPAWE